MQQNKKLSAPLPTYEKDLARNKQAIENVFRRKQRTK